MPWEVDDFQNTVYQLKRNLKQLDLNEGEIIFEVCLNLNSYFFDWNKSILKPTFFKEKVENYLSILDEITTKIHYYDTLGALDYKRYIIKDNKDIVDYFIWLDSDIFFPDNSLQLIIESIKQIKQQYDDFIITPQIPKLWDNTWDALVHQNYIHQIPSHENYFNFDAFEIFNKINDDFSLSSISYFKFGAGWLTTISSSIFKNYIKEFPESLGHYGIDDTYIMNVLDYYTLYKSSKVYQFIINNLLITENYKYRFNPYKNLIIQNEGIRLKEDFRKESEEGMEKEIKKLYLNEI